MSSLLRLYVTSGLGLCGLSIPLILGWVPPNWVYGFRVRRTKENPEVWYPVNKYAGKWLLGVGSAIVAGAVGLYLVPGISVDGYALGVLAVVSVGLTAAIGMSVRYLWRIGRGNGH